jgi:phospholipase/carboxylesterase
LRTLTRRRFVGVTGGALPAFLLQRRRDTESRIHARVGKPKGVLKPGEFPLGLATGRDGLLRVPSGYRPDTPAPLALLLHGAGGQARRIVSLLGVADSLGVIVLAPESRGRTWDAILGGFGPDVAFITQTLDSAFERLAIDPNRLAIGGFSDGASYALSLGLDNGDLFSHILAFSPGFIVSRSRQGRPRIYITHGTSDEILPIASTSRRLVPALDKAGYAVTYREFDGPHTVPPAVAHDAFNWFTRTSRSPQSAIPRGPDRPIPRTPDPATLRSASNRA